MKISVQTGNVVDRHGFEKGYKMLKDAGFEAIDWNLDHAWDCGPIYNGGYQKGNCIFEKDLQEVIEHYKEELEIIRKNGLEISQAHAPFPAYTPKCQDIVDYAIGVYIRLIEFCDYIGCPNLVIHGICYEMQDKGKTQADIDKMNDHMYESLIPVLQRTNVTVCLENIFSWKETAVEGHCQNAKEASRYIERLNEKAGKEAFGFCLDTGHSNLLRKDFMAVIPELGAHLKALHIHDNDGNFDRHLAPFTGTIDWNRFIMGLREIGYSHDLSFETFAQVERVKDFGEELENSWLKLIAEIGKTFKKLIEE